MLYLGSTAVCSSRVQNAGIKAAQFHRLPNSPQTDLIQQVLFGEQKDQKRGEQ